jgi:hypothetical protein
MSGIVLTVVFTVGPWSLAEDGKRHVANWVGDPRRTDNLAMRCVREGHFWPLTRWEWAIWAPFQPDEGDDSGAMADGTAASLDAAKAAAEQAMRAHIARSSICPPDAP